MIGVSGLRKSFSVEGEAHGRAAVNGVSFENPAGELLTLLGPSGCGKSTTLRCIAGLETPDEGQIDIGGQTVFSRERRLDIAPGKRQVGMVFQSYAIWPHMSVEENVEYPLKRRGVKGDARRERTQQALETVDLLHFAKRPAPALSGGQQQRVALARAIVAEPEVLLLDEPLSNLDARLRRELGDQLRELQQRLGLTVVYVTHDQDEAMAMSDLVALMEDGEIVEWGAPEQIYSRPTTAFGARFLGAANFLEATVTEAAAGSCAARTEHGPVHFDDPQGTLAVGDETLLMLRPEDARPADRSADAPNTFAGTVADESFRGPHWEYTLRAEGRSPINVRTQGARAWSVGDTAAVSFAPARCVPVRKTAHSTEVVDEAAAEPAAEPRTEGSRHASIAARQS